MQRVRFLICVPLGVVARAYRIEASSACSHVCEQPHHTFVVLADPQLGLKHQYDDAENWAAELDMFSKLVKLALEKSPAFIFLAGDMQNYWPNEKDSNGNPILGRHRSGPGQPIQSDETLMSGILGENQRAAVKNALRTGDVKVIYTAGNHDVGDTPDMETLGAYEKTWGPLYSLPYEGNTTLYLQFTSQFYWKQSQSGSDMSAETKQVKERQTAWLKNELSKIPDRIRRVVLLTHIPPFMNDPIEKAGWANWDEEDREAVLAMLAQYLAPKKVPVLWVVGHFHTNVYQEYVYKHDQHGQLDMTIAVTSSSGSPMWWDGAHDEGYLTPA